MSLVFNLKNVLLFFKYIYLFIKFIINYLVVFIKKKFGGGGCTFSLFSLKPISLYLNLN